ncbi:hypothetical protein M011DRAFT_480089 [Sporormia fimetaria CBS 119925]|uniref:AAA+ ATPase domain-containing protein n=1 Tax=Sporormia fimetaria CBS 119925 TaxID=1340428 RepID=A0A6A6V4L7_9PLEO|nr:hypothetical protein M011DRAFT_480089 [Sporormia fimetaria CBS 119925]
MEGQRTTKSADHSSSPTIDATPSSSAASAATPSTASVDGARDREVEPDKATDTKVPAPSASGAQPAAEEPQAVKAKKTKKAIVKKRKSKKNKQVVEDSSSESSSSDDDSSGSDSDDESTDDEKAKKRKKLRLRKEKAKKKAKVKALAKKRKHKKELSSSEDSDSDSDSSSSSSSSSGSDSESEGEQRSKKKKKASSKAKAKAKAKVKAKKQKSKKHESSSDSSSSDSSSSSSSSDSDSESESAKKRRRRKKRKSKAKKESVENDAAPTDSPFPTVQSTQSAQGVYPAINTSALPVAQDSMNDQLMAALRTLLVGAAQAAGGSVPADAEAKKSDDEKEKEKKRKNGKPEFKRVDQVWDNELRDFKMVDSAETKDQDLDSVFTVRRKFSYENEYRYTVVDIKSKLLQRSLIELLKDVKGLSLTEDTPSIDPNLLFLYYDELRIHYKKTLRARLRRQRKKKQKKQLTDEIAHCRLLVRYIDKDYKSIRKRLNPMLKAGTVTYDLVWALFKPKTIAYTPTYENQEDPRCFKVEFCTEEENYMEEKWWEVQGSYLEYDGKKFGLGDHVVKIEAFKGTRKITALPVYPLAYHKNPEAIKKQLVERGKKFISLQGINYRHFEGLAYQKIRNMIKKHNINSRVMVDPAIFRRINPNYPLSYLKADEEDIQSDTDEEDEGDSDSESCGCSEEENEYEPKMRWIVYKTKAGDFRLIRVPVKQAADVSSQKLEPTAAGDAVDDQEPLTFTEEELLIASPVVLGFSFKGKAWVEFSLSGIRDIEWNSTAFESLVLPTHIKQNLRGLVSSHRFYAAQTIGDVIEAKGKGLNVVLHGPPGVGKTLTAESIADFLRCPLYVVSAGELGTSSRTLEADLNRIMEVTHAWGAILLLDEADVFMEQRQPQDVHRNALVSVFLRLLEYYQGILFLTTNRAKTFDEAFNSRIHMGIRYENLNMKARREVWQQYIRQIESSKDVVSASFTNDDLDELSRKDLNGRQIKNAIGQAQLIALSEKKPFSMLYIKRTLAVTEEFEMDMRGGGNHTNFVSVSAEKRFTRTCLSGCLDDE